MGGCHNHGPILGPLNTRCRILVRTHKVTIILTTTHILFFASTACQWPIEGVAGHRRIQRCPPLFPVWQKLLPKVSVVRTEVGVCSTQGALYTRNNRLVPDWWSAKTTHLVAPGRLGCAKFLNPKGEDSGPYKAPCYLRANLFLKPFVE